jgi:hypothetical protein
MEATIAEGLKDLRSIDRDCQYNAYVRLLGATGQPVDWALRGAGPEALEEVCQPLEDPMKATFMSPVVQEGGMSRSWPNRDPF